MNYCTNSNPNNLSLLTLLLSTRKPEASLEKDSDYVNSIPSLINPVLFGQNRMTNHPCEFDRRTLDLMTQLQLTQLQLQQQALQNGLAALPLMNQLPDYNLGLGVSNNIKRRYSQNSATSNVSSMSTDTSNQVASGTELIEVDRVKRRKMRKSHRERARRAIINDLFMDLKGLLRKLHYNDAERMEPKNRELVLEELIETLRDKFGLPVPACLSSNASDSDTEGEEPKRKCEKEKERRRAVKALSEKVGMMIDCQEPSDHLKVMQMIVPWLEEKLQTL